MDPLNREIEVLVGPLADYLGGGDESLALRLFADGTQENLRIKFNIQKHMVSTSAPSTVSVYNLSRETRNALTKTSANISVSAGWTNTGRKMLFSGGLLSVVSHREGPEIVTVLSFLGGYGPKARAVTAKTFASGTPLNKLVEDAAKTFPAVSVDQTRRKTIQIRDFVVGSSGLTLSGSTTEILNKLSRQYGFSWWIDNNVFYALDDSQIFAGNSALVTSKNGFLKRAEPILSSPFQQQAGVTVETIFNPLIDVGRDLTVESEINPAISGSYKVQSLTHSGDSHSPSWDTRVESYTYGL